ncbi:recombinase family protein [Kitasatospora camelliae]|uniref:Recombinase family protein n=1 Tax=Kitasatospora camelliae TaxID=3156397 RepID=A0AAU8K6W7_9ACTN
MPQVKAGSRSATEAGLTPAIGYIRVSMAREEMISPELQRAAITDWAKRTGHRIIDWVEDLDKTGRTFKRRIMGVIERVERGEASVIAVWKYSRFGRTRTGVPANLARVEKAGGQLISATEAVDATTAVGRFQRGMIMEFNAFESDRAGEQWMETHQWRRDHGLPAVGRPRFGYIWHQRKIYQPDGTITLQEERYEPDPNLSPVVQSLYQRYIAGESFRALALWLNEEGHRTRGGGVWSGKAVRRYLDSGFAVGYLRFHKKSCPMGSVEHGCEEYELVRHPTMHHAALIGDDVWQLYQQRRDFTKTAAPRARNAGHPLTGLVFCGLCQYRARRSVDGRRQHTRFACMPHQEKGHTACRGTSLRDTLIIDEIRKRLAEFVAEFDSAVDAAATIPVQRRHDPVRRRLDEVDASIAKLEKAIVRHMRVYAMADDDDLDGTLEKEYLETLGSLRAEKALLAGERDELRSVVDGGGEAAVRGAAVPVAIGLLEEWDTLEPGRLNAMLRRVIGRVELLGDKQARVLMAWEV